MSHDPPPEPDDEQEDDDEERESDVEQREVPAYYPPRPRARVGASIPLFPDLGKDPARIPGKLLVERLDPPHGHLGEAPLDADEETLKRLYGGRVLALSVRATNGQLIKGGKRIVTIDAPPVSPSESRELASAQAQGRHGGQDTPAMMRAVVDEQARLAAQQRELAREQLAMIKAEHEAGLQRREKELDLAMRRQKEEAELREERERQRFEREIERERERAKEREREFERQRSAEDSRSKEFMALVLGTQKEQTQFMMSVMTKAPQTDPVALFERGMQLAAGMHQEDPGVEITKSITSGLQNLATLATARAERADRNSQTIAVKRIPTAPVAGSAGATKGKTLPPGGAASSSTSGGDDLAGKRQRIMQKLATLFEGIKQSGLDPESVLDDLIEGKTTIVDSDELDEDEDENTTEETEKSESLDNKAGATHVAPKNGSPVESRGRQDEPPAGGTSVESGDQGGGGPEAA